MNDHGFKTCAHNCHDHNAQSRLSVAMKNISIFSTLSISFTSNIIHCLISELSRSGGGANVHAKKHQCDEDTYIRFGCPSPQEPGSWVTTPGEIIKFGARLAWGRTGRSLQKTVDCYKLAWQYVYPDQEVPLTDGDTPIDFLWNDNYLCDNVPWLADVPKSESLTGN
jgi:hypothetical protein